MPALGPRHPRCSRVTDRAGRQAPVIGLGQHTICPARPARAARPPVPREDWRMTPSRRRATRSTPVAAGPWRSARSGRRRPPGARDALVRARPALVQDRGLLRDPLRGFVDGNGDGTGDLRGLIERLDYLQWLGIDCLWLLPFYPSPLRDGGYDISDYYRDPPGLRHDGRLRGVRRRGPPARHPRDRRPRDEPHLERPPLVPGPARIRRRRNATGTSGRTPTTATGTRGSSSSTPRRPTGPGTRSPGPVLLAPLLLATSRT